jgi:hypothetical protein
MLIVCVLRFPLLLLLQHADDAGLLLRPSFPAELRNLQRCSWPQGNGGCLCADVPLVPLKWHAARFGMCHNFVASTLIQDGYPVVSRPHGEQPLRLVSPAAFFKQTIDIGL